CRCCCLFSRQQRQIHNRPDHSCEWRHEYGLRSSEATGNSETVGKNHEQYRRTRKKIVCEQLGVKEEDVKASSSFVDDLGADSLDTVELVMALEEEFETEIPDEAAEKLTTVQEAIDYIIANL